MSKLFNFAQGHTNITVLKDTLSLFDERMTRLYVALDRSSKIAIDDKYKSDLAASKRRVKDIRVALTECKDAVCFLDMAIDKAEYDGCLDEE
jgi:hypothetical protein